MPVSAMNEPATSSCHCHHLTHLTHLVTSLMGEVRALTKEIRVLCNTPNTSSPPSSARREQVGQTSNSSSSGKGDDSVASFQNDDTDDSSRLAMVPPVTHSVELFGAVPENAKSSSSKEKVVPDMFTWKHHGDLTGDSQGSLARHLKPTLLLSRNNSLLPLSSGSSCTVLDDVKNSLGSDANFVLTSPTEGLDHSFEDMGSTTRPASEVKELPGKGDRKKELPFISSSGSSRSTSRLLPSCKLKVKRLSLDPVSKSLSPDRTSSLGDTDEEDRKELNDECHSEKQTSHSHSVKGSASSGFTGTVEAKRSGTKKVLKPCPLSRKGVVGATENELCVKSDGEGSKFVKKKVKRISYLSSGELLVIKQESRSLPNFAVKLAKCLYTYDELRSSRCAGGNNKKKLDSHKLQFIKENVVSSYSAPVEEMEKTWNMCKCAINSYASSLQHSESVASADGSVTKEQIGGRRKELTEDEVKAIHKASRSMTSFAVRLSKAVFTGEEFMTSNCNGRKGKTMLDSKKLDFVKGQVQKYYNISDEKMESTWRICVLSIDSLARKLRQNKTKPLAESDILAIKQKSCLPKNFAVKLAKRVFTKREILTSNCSGICGKHTLDPARMNFIRLEVKRHFNLSDKMMKKTWANCKMAINASCRDVRYIERKKQSSLRSSGP